MYSQLCKLLCLWEACALFKNSFKNYIFTWKLTDIFIGFKTGFIQSTKMTATTPYYHHYLFIHPLINSFYNHCIQSYLFRKLPTSNKYNSKEFADCESDSLFQFTIYKNMFLSISVFNKIYYKLTYHYNAYPDQSRLCLFSLISRWRKCVSDKVNQINVNSNELNQLL